MTICTFLLIIVSISACKAAGKAYINKVLNETMMKILIPKKFIGEDIKENCTNEIIKISFHINQLHEMIPLFNKDTILEKNDVDDFNLKVNKSLKGLKRFAGK